MNKSANMTGLCKAAGIGTFIKNNPWVTIGSLAGLGAGAFAGDRLSADEEGNGTWTGRIIGGLGGGIAGGWGGKAFQDWVKKKLSEGLTAGIVKNTVGRNTNSGRVAAGPGQATVFHADGSEEVISKEENERRERMMYNSVEYQDALNSRRALERVKKDIAEAKRQQAAGDSSVSAHLESLNETARELEQTIRQNDEKLTAMREGRYTQPVQPPTMDKKR